MSWYVAKSLIKLRDQINTAYPSRDKSSDGTIGDAAHASRSSDHNPWVRDSKGLPVVTALDITHDPSRGVDCNRIVQELVANKDTRIKYIIWNKQIWNPSVSADWRKYTGSNPHTKHFHLSVKDTEKLYNDDTAWRLDFNGEVAPPTEPVKVLPLLKRGNRGQNVAKLQILLGIKADAIFGNQTYKAVVEFQKKHGLTPDGIVGPYTWEKLDA